MGRGILDHGLQHLGSGNHALAHDAALADQRLLDSGNLDEGDLHAQIAAGDHDAGTNRADLLHIIHARTVLDLRNDLDIAAAVGIPRTPADPEYPAWWRRKMQQ